MLPDILKGIINKGKSFITAPDNSTAGIIRNTITGIPQAAKDVFLPTRGYTEQQLNPKNITLKEKIKSAPTLKEKIKAVPKVATEIYTGIGQLGSMGLDLIPGHQERIQRLVQTKPGSSLSGIFPKLEEYQKPKTVGEAKAMRYTDVLGFLPIGSIKNIPKASKVISATKDINIINKELKGLGLADDAIKTYAPILTNVNDEKRVADIISKAYIPKQTPISTIDNTVESIVQQGKNAPELAQQAVKQAEILTPSVDNLPSLPKIKTESGIVSKGLDDVIPKSKTTFVDYFRTPDRVLEKLGFGKQMQKLRVSHENYLKDFQANVNQISNWRSQLPKESSVNIFKYLDGQKVAPLSPDELRVATEIKQYLANWADTLGLPQEKRVSNYITRIFDDKSGTIDKDLAKILSEKLPGGIFNPYEMARTGGKGYVEDVWKALDAYASKATRKLNLDEAIGDFKAGNSLADVDFDYVKKFLDGINFRPSKIDTLLDNTIESVLSKFGKTGEKVSNKLGNRPSQKILSPLRSMGYRGTLGLNIGSALKNMSQGVNTIATIGEKNAIKGYTAMLRKSNLKELIDEGVLNYGFIEDTLKQSKIGAKIDKGLFAFFEGAEKINRGAAYFGGKAKALSEGKTTAEAIEYGKEIARKTQFQFGELDTPLFLRSQLAKTVFQLQSFTVKQVEFLTEMAMKDKNFAGLLKYAVYGVAFQQTLGQLFGMEMKDLIPGVRLGSGLVLKPIVETGKAIFDAPDKYGADRTLETKAKDIGTSLLPLIPASSQAKKTIGGIQLISEGESTTDTGKVRFEAPKDLSGQVRAILFGKYNTEEGQKYISSDFKTTRAVKTEKEIAQEVLDKVNSGELGSVSVAKEYFKTELEKAKTAAKNDRLDLPQKEYAKALLDAIESKTITSDEAKKEFTEYKKQDIKKDDNRGKIKLGMDYFEAFTIDPQNAFKALFTKEQLGDVEGNLVELKRFNNIKFTDKGGSEEKKKELMLKEGIPWSNKKDYKLEHITPVSAGGDTSDSNLFITNNDLHDFYTPIDIAVGNAVKKGKITRKEAKKLMTDLKVNKTITPEEIIKLIK